MGKDTFFYKKKSIQIKGELIFLDSPLIMSILNITPDSFYNGSRYTKIENIEEQISKMINDGANIIDIGAVSTRPYSENVSYEEELQRLLPTFKLIKQKFTDKIFSIDTYNSEIAKIAVNEYGFSIVNDISSGDMDKCMIKTVAKLKVPYISMHMQGEPNNMQTNPKYNSVISDILKYFSNKIKKIKDAGIVDIIIDPGLGFGKTIEDNYKIIKNLKDFEILNLPILIGASRKSMIYKPLNINPEDALNGTTFINTLAINNGADILRVHDTKQAQEIIKLYNLYKTC